MIGRIAELRAEAEAAIAAASTGEELEQARVRFLGRKAELPNLLRGVRELPADERAAAGKAANEARAALEALIERRAAEIAGGEGDSALARERVDVTLPPDPDIRAGALHLLTQTQREIEDVFLGLGYRVAEGPEIELASFNFDALNTPPTHPSRELTDTFYVAPTGPENFLEPGALLLRTHTSPVQIRAMAAQPPPIYVIAPGRVYRRDADATHTPQFHQIEGLAIDEGITLADLRGTLREFARAIFGERREVRMRPHFFPFTEPSVEVDVSCFRCDGGALPDGSRCPICKGSTWIEILGAGMVDPNVLGWVAGHGYDPERVQGFAFGMGVERIAMLRHEVPDLRLFFDNDVRFLEQFA
jgi:phenylalanyl-tRNA synthetase alpha chain